MFYRFKDFKQGDAVVVGADTSMGAGDWCVAQFLVRPLKVIARPTVPQVYRTKSAAPQMTDDLVEELESIYDVTGIKPIVAYERNNGGAFEMERLIQFNRNHKFEVFKQPTFGREDAPEAVKYGIDTTSSTRPSMLSSLKGLIDKREIDLFDKVTIGELFSFINVRTSSTWKAQAEPHAHDDHVMSLAITWMVHELADRPVAPVETEMLMQAQALALAGDW